MNMKQAAYWEAQENRWHEKYLEAEGLIDRLETKVWEQASRIETLEAALLQMHEYSMAYKAREILKAALGDENV